MYSVRIKKFLFAALLCVFFSLFAFGTTAFAAEGEAFTPGGNGTVIDNVIEKNGKEFYTIKTEAGNVFYLVVDRLRDTDNVYFLNAVTESDLLALAEISGLPIQAITGEESSGTVKPPPGQPQQPSGEKPPSQGFSMDDGMTTYIFIGIAVVVVGGVGFYLKIVKGKKRRKDDDFDDYEEDDYDYSDDGDNDSNSGVVDSNDSDDEDLSW